MSLSTLLLADTAILHVVNVLCIRANLFSHQEDVTPARGAIMRIPADLRRNRESLQEPITSSTIETFPF